MDKQWFQGMEDGGFQLKTVDLAICPQTLGHQTPTQAYPLIPNHSVCLALPGVCPTFQDPAFGPPAHPSLGSPFPGYLGAKQEAGCLHE